MKAVSKSVSLPDTLWAKIETHAPTTPGRDRSGYIRNLVEADLKAAGALEFPGDLRAELLAAADELGIETILAAIRREQRRKGKAA